MSTESLQRIFKTLADPTRVRILSLLEQEELAVQELTSVLGMTQSRVSRHLGILRGAGLLRDRRDGTFVYYRFPAPEAGAWRAAWELVQGARSDDAAYERDRRALRRIVDARASGTRAWFDAVGPEWDALRKVIHDDALRAGAVAHLVPPGLRVVDVGTGTGILALEMARLGLRVIAVDQSPAMIEAVRGKLAGRDGLDVELRLGDARALPLADAEVDAALAHMVLHYLPSPGDAIRELARVVRPGGAVVVVDFVSHELEWMRQELGVLWLGFEIDDVRRWLTDAGLRGARIESRSPEGRDRDLPAAFLASARRPA